MTFLVQWLVRAVAIAITAYLLPGVRLSGLFAALVTALVLGLVNTFIKPLLLLLTLGLLTFVINALLIMLTSAIVPGFSVKNFGWALLFSLVLAIINYFLGAIVF